jgi:hypothetical protein
MVSNNCSTRCLHSSRFVHNQLFSNQQILPGNHMNFLQFMVADQEGFRTLQI